MECVKTQSTTPTASGLSGAIIQANDRLVDYREATPLLGSKCKTPHFCRRLERRGLLRAIRLSPRCVRYSLSNVMDIVGGKGGRQ